MKKSRTIKYYNTTTRNALTLRLRSCQNIAATICYDFAHIYAHAPAFHSSPPPSPEPGKRQSKQCARRNRKERCDGGQRSKTNHLSPDAAALYFRSLYTLQASHTSLKGGPSLRTPISHAIHPYHPTYHSVCMSSTKGNVCAAPTNNVPPRQNKPKEKHRCRAHTSPLRTTAMKVKY